MGYLAVPVGQMQGRKRRPAEAGQVFLTQQVAYCHKREPVRLSVAQHWGPFPGMASEPGKNVS